MTQDNSVKTRTNNPPPIVYILAILLSIFFAPRFWNILQPFIFGMGKSDRTSMGEQILIQENVTLEKKQGIEKFAQGNYLQASQHFENSLLQEPNDPETLIYLNNAQASDNALKIAVSVPISSNLNIAQEILRGVAQAQDAINQKVGINGQKLQVEIVDDKNDPEIAKQVAEDLVSDPQVLAVIGHNASNASLAAAPIYQQGKLVMVSPTSMANNLSGMGNYIFRTVPTSQVMAEALADYTVNVARKKKMAFCVDSQAPDNVSFKDEFVAAFVHHGGQITPTVCDLSAPNFNAATAVSQAISGGADGLFISSHIDRLDGAIDLARANQGRLALFSSPTLYTIKTLETGQQDVKQLVLVAPWHPQSDRNFAQTMEQRWRGQVSWRTAMAYDATEAIIAGLYQGNSREQLQQVLRSSSFSVRGASGTVKFTPTGDRIGQPVIVQVQSSHSGYEFVMRSL
jgi:branched-chain amino acid transport system substrate-binding protein